MGNRMKALYTIKLPKSEDGSRIAQTAESVNEERLNDNFRTIGNELVHILDGDEQRLNLLSARVSSSETGLAALNQTVNEIQVETEENTSAIAMVPGQITSEVASSLQGYATKTYVDDAGNAISSELVNAEHRVSSQVSQLSNALNVEINERTTIGDAVSLLSSWVRIVGADANAGTNPGVIIGRTTADASLKAEADAIFFYKGQDTDAKKTNQLAGFDSAGNFQANALHTSSTLLDDKFDIDVVAAGGVDFLHITGRI